MTGDKDDTRPPAARGRKNKALSGEDLGLWDFVTRTVRPLTGRPRTPPPVAAPPSPPARPASGPDLTAWQPAIGLKAPPSPAAPSAGGTDRRTAAKLRRGQMRVEAVLDLHGLRQGEAREQLQDFLTRHHSAGRRCVLVITGKGYHSAAEQAGEHGVLRRMVPHWLGVPPLAGIVLDYAPARPQDGGEGALYILLRRQRPS